MKKTKLLLASASPARKLLLKQLGLKFHTDTSPYEEDMTAYSDPARLSKFLAENKAIHIAHKHPDTIVIAADTFARIKNKNIGKPKNLSHAKKIIKSMSNNKVEVHTGLAILKTDKHGDPQKIYTDHVVTTLTFTKLTPRQISQIAKNDRVTRVAGALTIEGEAGKYVKHIEGNYHNVIGLPLYRVQELLTHFGIHA